MQHPGSILIAIALIAGLAEAPAAAEEPVYEMRIYTANEGKMDALHARFRNHTMALFERHGMKNVGYWSPVDEPDTLIYVLAHDSVAAAEASWKAFVADPEWRAVYAASIADGRLVAKIENTFMKATDFSPR